MTTAKGSAPFARSGLLLRRPGFVSPLLWLSVVFLLLAASCAGNGDGPEDAQPPAAPSVSDESAESTDSPSSAGGTESGATDGDPAGSGDGATGTGDQAEADAEPGSIEELEASWQRARSEVVESIGRAGYGVDADNVLRGPNGFSVDLDDCPAGWDDQAGVGDTIKIVQTSPQTGELWAYGLIADGLGIYFDYVNRTGGVAGKQLELVVVDDGYDRSRTVELVDELITSEPPLAITTFGGPTSFAVTERLNDECIPQPFVMSNHPAWGDPMNQPWTTGLQLAYNTEALLWGSWIKQNMGGRLPVTVGALVVDSEFGSLYEQAFSLWAEQNPDVVAEFVPIRHGERTPSVSAEMQRIAELEPDVFIAMTNESPCLLAVLAAGEVGLTESDTTLFTSSVCRSADLYMVPAGGAADGFLSMGGGWRIPNDPAQADNPFMQWVNATLAEAQADTAIGFFGSGFAYYGWAYVEALRIAAELDGGVTRSNLILAQRAMNVDHPGLLPGIEFSMGGGGDGYFVEGSNVDVFDARTGAWQPSGPVLDLNGLTPSCAWADTACTR